MSWTSGSCGLPPDGGSAWISTDAYPEPVRITDADVLADNADVVGDLDMARSSSE